LGLAQGRVLGFQACSSPPEALRHSGAGQRLAKMNEGPHVRGCSGQQDEAEGFRAQCSEHPAQEVEPLWATSCAGVTTVTPPQGLPRHIHTRAAREGRNGLFGGPVERVARTTGTLHTAVCAYSSEGDREPFNVRDARPSVLQAVSHRSMALLSGSPSDPALCTHTHTHTTGGRCTQVVCTYL